MKAGLTLTGLLAAASTLAQTPTLVGHVPARHATAASRTAPITLTFSQPASGGGAVRVYSAQRGLLAGTASGAGTTTLSWQPAQPLLPGEQVSVSVPAVLAGPGGGRTFSFRAATAPGNGSFAAPLDLPLPAGAVLHFRSSLTLADLNHDGYLDAVVTGATTVYSALGNGQGSFGSWSNLPLNGTLQGFTLADYNQDGYLDAVWPMGSALYAASGNGAGGFGPTTLLWTEPVLIPQAQSVSIVHQQLADINGDGALDCLYQVSGYFGRLSTTTGYYVGCRLGNRLGQFGPLTGQSAGSYGYQPVALTDSNNDDRLDYLNATDTGIAQYLGDGTGGFAAGPGFYQLIARLSVVAVSDLTGDGQVDLLLNFASSSSGTGTYFYPALDLAGKQLVDATEVADLQTVDLNGDGNLDLLSNFYSSTSTAASSPAHWRKNLGGGNFSTPDTLTNSRSFRLTTGDVNGDGTLDLVTLRVGGASDPPVLRVLRQQPATALAARPSASDLAVQLYPNPAHQATTVQLPSVPGAATATLRLTDALGHLVLDRVAPLGQPCELPLHGLPPGIYCLRVQAGPLAATRKLLVEY